MASIQFPKTVCFQIIWCWEHCTKPSPSYFELITKLEYRHTYIHSPLEYTSYVVYVYTYRYMYVQSHVNTHIHTYVYSCMYVHICTYIRKHVRMYAHMYTHTQHIKSCTYVCMFCIFTNVHTYICTYIRPYTHTHIHTDVHRYIRTYAHTDTHTYRHVYVHTLIYKCRSLHMLSYNTPTMSVVPTVVCAQINLFLEVLFKYVQKLLHSLITCVKICKMLSHPVQ